MKLRLFATAALVAAAVSAPAFAQPVGSAGLSAAQVEAEIFGFEGDGQVYTLDGSVALKASEAWTVTLNGAVAQTDGDLGDDSTYGVGAALTYAGSDWRLGPVVTVSELADETLWTVGGVAQKYMDNVTLSGQVNYGNVDGIDADIWTVGGEARYFVSDTFRLNANLGWTTVDAGGGELDGWNAGVGGEYQFAGTPWSVFGGYQHAAIDDLDFDADIFSLGVRVSFGGDLKARDRSGADLGAAANPFASAF